MFLGQDKLHSDVPDTDEAGSDIEEALLPEIYRSDDDWASNNLVA